MSNEPRSPGTISPGGLAGLTPTGTPRNPAGHEKKERHVPQGAPGPTVAKSPPPTARPAVPSAAPAGYANARVIVMSPGGESVPSTPTSGPTPTVRTATPSMPQKAVETSARRLPDVNVDVQQTSPRAMMTEPLAHTNAASVGKSIPACPPKDLQPDVQLTSPRSASVADPKPRSTPARKAKRQTDQDASGRYRHTLRLEPKAEQKLRAVAESRGVDRNAAISVCIAEKYSRLCKPGSGDV